MNKRIKKKCAKRDNTWHYSAFKKMNELCLFERQPDGTVDMIHIKMNKAHTKIRKAFRYVNCVPFHEMSIKKAEYEDELMFNYLDSIYLGDDKDGN